jgi:hypothetical protein
MRKPILLICALMLLAGHSLVHAQDNALKINLISPLMRTLNLSYEHKLNANSGIQLGLYYTGFSASDVTFRGFGITPEYRYYLSESEAIKGTYIGPFLRYTSLTVEEELFDGQSEGTYSGIGGGLVIGRQWVFKEKITLDTFIGPQFISGNYKAKSGSDNIDVDVFDGFGLRAGITLGFAF